FVEAARERGAQVIAMSALLTTTMPGMKQTVEAVEQAGLRGQVKVMVGGAPVTQRFAEEIGADGFSDNASGAVRAVRELVSA
ncbi:MAG: cobalamin-dependent protein, partial [Chthonomonadales bacterium]|nr:cobalamin-dependent protein [Chthonomonadales bacterium]